MGKSKIKPFIITGIILLIIGLVVGIYYYINTDFLKTPKTLFTKYLSQSLSLFNDYGGDVDKSLKEFTKNTNYKEVGSTTINLVNSQNIGNSYIVKTEFEKDVTNNKAHSTISFNFKDNELLTGDFYSKNDLYGIHINNLTDGIVSVRNEELKSLANNLGYDNIKIPNRIVFEKNNDKTIEEEFTPILEKYLVDFNKNFSNDNFTKEKKVKCSVESVDYICNKYMLNTNIDTFYNFFKTELEKAKEDDLLKNVLLNRFNISNDLYIELIDNEITRLTDLIEKNDGNTSFIVSVYESNGNIIKLEAGTDTILYEFYVSHTEGIYKVYFNYNNIESSSRKTIEYLKISFENKYDSENQDMTLSINSKNRSNVELLGTGAEYNESNIIIKYAIKDFKDNTVNKAVSFTFNNKKIIDYKSKLTIGVNVSIDDITSDNSYVLNDMQIEEVRNLINNINDNTQNFINTSHILEEIPEESDENILVDLGDIWSARRDLENAFTKIIANYNLDNEGSASLKEYFDLSKLVQNLSLGNDINLSNDKNTIVYKNKDTKIYEFNILFSENNITIQRMNEIIPEPEPEPELEPEIEPEPEVVEEIPEEYINPNDDIISTMKTEINSYLAAVYDEAISREEGILAEDYINNEQIVANCATVYECYIEEQEIGVYYIECRDVDGNLYSGIIRINDTGINLVTFN